MAKVFLGVGHGGSDPGAVKYLKEADLNLRMAIYCRDYLKRHGVEVRMSRTNDENDPLSEEIRECNAFNPDLAVDIHNNAGGGEGFEAYHYHKGGKSKKLAENIESEIKKIGQKSRGLKTRLNSSGNDYYGFIRCIKAPSIIVEGVFVDNKKDAAKTDENCEQKAFGEAYAKGILKTLGISDKHEKPVVPQNTSYLVKINTDELNVRSGPGTGYKVNTKVHRNEVYTIVSEHYNGKTKWGRLKSGAGYISLKYTKKC